MKHLLGIEQLTESEIIALIDSAEWLKGQRATYTETSAERGNLGAHVFKIIDSYASEF